MLVWVPVPLLGVVVERAYVGRAAEATVRASLRGIKRWCEAGG
jgi:hypothetical protein